MEIVVLNLLPVPAKGLANLILDWADADNIEVSPMKLQKLLFFCHADFLVQVGLPLIDQKFEAWDYGPVIPSIYQQFKKDGNKAIHTRAESFDPITASTYVPKCVLPAELVDQLRGFYVFYRGLSALTLSDLSHSRTSPWRQARSLFANGLNADREIDDDMIRRFHRLFHA